MNFLVSFFPLSSQLKARFAAHEEVAVFLQQMSLCPTANGSALNYCDLSNGEMHLGDL